MKLRSLAVNQFKKFTTPIRLEGIEDGLNVVVGPNEMGKSTLLDAFLAVLFEKHSSKAQPIMALQNDRNQAAPVVELAFELDDGPYRITKRFIKKPYAQLSCPDGRSLEGDAAEDTLRGLLDFDEPGKTGAKPESLGMWKVLWVQQGQSFGALDLPERARSSLHSALESEVGTVLGGRRGRALPQAIEKQLSDLITGSTNRPRGAYKELIDRVETVIQELDDLRNRRQDLTQTLNDLEEAQETLERLSTGNRDQADQNELDEARQRYRWLAELEARIEAASTELKLRKRTLDQAEQAAVERKQLKDDINAEETALEEARQRLVGVRKQEKQVRSRVDALRAVVRQSETAVTQADEAVSRCRRVLGTVERQARLRDLEGRCKKAQAADKRRREAQQAAAAILVTDQAIMAIHKAAKGLQAVQGRLNAAATLISFDMTYDGLSGIKVNGDPVTDDRLSVQAVEPVTITVPDRGRITVAPAIAGREELLRRQRNAKTSLKEALAVASVKSVADADDQYAKRQKLLRDGDLASQEAELYAPATNDHEAGAQALADYIEGLRQVLKREMNELDLHDLPARQEAETAFRTAQGQAVDARNAPSITARAALSGPDDTLGNAPNRNRHISRVGTTRARTGSKSSRTKLPKRKKSDHTINLQAAIEGAHAALSDQETAIATS